MGKDKARLRLGRKTFLGCVRSAAREAGLPVRLVRRDLIPRCGPLGGVFTGLKTSRTDLSLFLSCDMPFVSAALLRELVSRVRPAARAIFTRERKPGFPFLIRRAALDHVQTLIAQESLSLQELCRSLKADLFRPPAERSFELLNINTRADYARAQRAWKQLHV